MAKLTRKTCEGCTRDCWVGVRNRHPVCSSCRSPDDKPPTGRPRHVIQNGRPSFVDETETEEWIDPYHGEIDQR